MGESFPSSSCGVTRRGFLVGAATGLAAGGALTWLGLRNMESAAGHATGSVALPGRPAAAPSTLAMPGPYPGRVIEVRHPGAVSADHRINQDAVNAMIDRGMKELTGADHPRDAWRRFFCADDVVGIKVNPVGRKPLPGEGRVPGAVGVISSPEVVLKVVRELKEAGVKPRNIILFERYADEFERTGYEALTRERGMEGVRWYASAAAYTNTQLDIHGFDLGRDHYSFELCRHVVGYDPDVFVHMGFAAPDHSEKDDRRFRSHLSLIVTKMVNKIITIPCLKDHRSAGVTLALKNLSHGMNNNVARSHISGVVRLDGSVSGPNQCNTFIPTAASQHPLREKATLHILDGLIGVYEGGPGSWNATWGTWHHKGLLFATDPVALDHIGWEIIDAQRARMGWPSVAQMGLLQDTPEVKFTRAAAALGSPQPVGTVALAAAAKNIQESRGSESFDVRQPQHVILAGDRHGLGFFNRENIVYRPITIRVPSR